MRYDGCLSASLQLIVNDAVVSTEESVRDLSILLLVVGDVVMVYIKYKEGFL